MLLPNHAQRLASVFGGDFFSSAWYAHEALFLIVEWKSCPYEVGPTGTNLAASNCHWPSLHRSPDCL